MSNGFGFSFNSNDDGDGDNGDNDRDRSGQNPYGSFSFKFGPTDGSAGGSLGDMLNQFGQMLSGMGSSMNSDDASPVNWEVAQRIAHQQIGGTQGVRANDQQAVEESVRLAELWLDGSTALPASNGKVTVWNPEHWVNETLPGWQRLVNPVAEQMNEAQLNNIPDEAREMMGPMMDMMKQMTSMNYGMQVGHALGDLAKQSLTGSDFGLPVAPEATIAILPANCTGAAEELSLPQQEVVVYTAAREAARQRLFTHVPWLVERLVSSVEEYALGLVIDTSHFEEAAREMSIDPERPQSLEEALNRMQSLDLSPRITSRNSAAVSRLETLLALVEGWAEFVVSEALHERIPSTQALTEAWRRRRATGGSAEQAFAHVVGIEFSAPKVAEAVELWRRATVAVGAERRDQVWDHPDFLPTAEHLDAPADFIDGLLDDSEDTTFEDELAKLEEMLRKEDPDKQDPDERGWDDGSQDGTEL